MSYYGLITFSFFQRPATYVQIAREFLCSGWRPGNGNPEGLIGVDSRDEKAEWIHRTFAHDELDSAFSFLQTLEASHREFFFDMSWGEDGTRIRLRPDVDGKKLFVSLYSGHHMLPGLGPYVDHTWYTPKFLIPLNRLNCIVDVLEWDESA